jgi:MFS family permease
MADATKEETSRVEAPRGSVVLQTTDDVNRIEAPVTLKAYLICAFASFGGIFFGYDSGYVNGVLGNQIFIDNVEGPGHDAVSSSHQSLIVSILSLGTFLGALIGGDAADFIGRKWTVILGCVIYTVGVIIQMITGEGDALAAIVVGRVVAGIGVGFESAIVILYMSEIVSPLYIYVTIIDFCSAPAKFVALSLLVTNSVSLSVFCSHPSSSMRPRTDPTLAHTAFPLPFNSPGP